MTPAGAMQLHNNDGPTLAPYESLRSVFARAAPGMVISDFKGNIVDANESFVRIVDRSPEQISSGNVFDLIHPDDQSKHQVLLEKLLASQVSNFVIEKRYVRPNGSTVWVRNSVTLLGEERSAPKHLITICEDINQRKQAEEALKYQEQMAVLGRLASSIVHEINNPLETSINLIYMAQQSDGFEEAKKYLAIAEEELGRAANIAAQGLQFQRHPAAPTEVDITGLVESVLLLFHDKFSRANVRVDFHPTDAPKLLCFPGEMRQVCVNLISNAIDAMPDGGRLRIRVRPATDWHTNRPGVRITIADNGCGMDAYTRDRMYEAFFTTKGAAGSGLGLWITANIVNKHQGSIHVRGKKMPKSGGTVFTLIFPHSGAEGKVAGLSDPQVKSEES